MFDLEQVVHRQYGQEWVPHWHDEWSFGAVIAGRCRCSVAGRPFVPEAGDVVAIAPGVVHTGALLAPAPDSPVEVVMLYVPVAWLEGAGLRPPARSGWAHLPALARNASGLSSPDAVAAWLRRAVAALAGALPARPDALGDPSPTAAERALIRRLESAVLDGEQSVSGLARRCAVSRERVHRVMTRLLGMTPRDYLRAVRLHRARQMVTEGAPIARVAAECGFADQAHFTRWFRRTFGYTPGALASAMSRHVAAAASGTRGRRHDGARPSAAPSG